MKEGDTCPYCNDGILIEISQRRCECCVDLDEYMKYLLCSSCTGTHPPGEPPPTEEILKQLCVGKYAIDK